MRRRTHSFWLFHLDELWEDEPSEFIQEIARSYCEDRPLYRPNVSYLSIILKWLFIVTICYLFYYFVIYLSVHVLLPRFYPENKIIAYCKAIEGKSEWLFPLIATSLTLCILLRRFAIDCIRLYQRYAPESVRRRCILMPSCSDFAILAIKKYGLFFGGILTYYRLYHRCIGTINRIEYP